MFDPHALHALERALLQLARYATPELRYRSLLVLLYVASRHPREVSATEIADALKLSTTATSASLGELVNDANLVTVREDPTNQRRRLVRLTADGIACVALMAEANH